MLLRKTVLTAIVGLFLVSACVAPAQPATDAMPERGAMQSETKTESSMMTDTMAMTDTMTDTMTGSMAMTYTMGHDAMVAGEMMSDTHPMTDTMAGTAMLMDRPVWQTLPLTDARTGASFTLADFAGKTVFVETMATWCTNCRQQLGNVKRAVTRADTAQAVFIAISVETDLAAERLAQYADDNDFAWTFVVATPALVRALSETFGPTIANPPATPHFLIHPDGSHSDLVTGYESGDAILAQITS